MLILALSQIPEDDAKRQLIIFTHLSGRIRHPERISLWHEMVDEWSNRNGATGNDTAH